MRYAVAFLEGLLANLGLFFLNKKIISMQKIWANSNRELSGIQMRSLQFSQIFSSFWWIIVPSVFWACFIIAALFSLNAVAET